MAELLGHETVCANLLDSDVYEDAVEDGFGRLLAITKNDALCFVPDNSRARTAEMAELNRSHLMKSSDSRINSSVS